MNSLFKTYQKLTKAKRHYIASFVLGCLGGAAVLITYLVLFRQDPLQAEKIFSKVRPQIVEFVFRPDETLRSELVDTLQLKGTDFLDKSGFCSGFFIDTNILLTAFHCMRGKTFTTINTNFDIVAHDGKIIEVESVVWFDLHRDYILLKTKNASTYGHFDLEKGVKSGQKVFTIGNVEGDGIVIRDGLISSVIQDKDRPELLRVRYSAAASPGNSGGPLVTQSGRVVALVFARSMAENFNMGTPAKDIYDQLARVRQVEKVQHVKVDFEGYPYFYTREILNDFAMPVLSNWNNSPSSREKFRLTNFDVDIIGSLETFSKQYLERFEQAFKKIYEEELDTLEKNKLMEGHWQNFDDGELGYLYAPDFYDSAAYQVTKGVLVPQTFITYGSPDSRTYEAFKKATEKGYHATFRPSRVETRFSPASSNIGKTIVYGLGDDKINLFDLSYDAKLLTFDGLKHDGDTKHVLAKNILSALFWKDGEVLFDTFHLEFLRPKSSRQYAVTNRAWDVSHSQVTDKRNRKWDIFEWKILGLNLQAFCLPAYGSDHCFVQIFEDYPAQLLKIKKENMVTFNLSERFIHMPFISLDKLTSQNMKTSFLASDIALKSEENALRIIFKHAELEFPVSNIKKPMAARIVGGLVSDDSQAPKWVALGLDLIFHDKKNAYRGCSVAIEPKNGMRRKAFLDLERELKEDKKKGKISPIKVEAIYRFNEKKEWANLWSYCIPLKADPENGEIEWQEEKSPFQFSWVKMKTITNPIHTQKAGEQ